MSLVVMHNSYQNMLFFRHTSAISTSISDHLPAFEQYFNLKKENSYLEDENLKLKNELEKIRTEIRFSFSDSLAENRSFDVDYVYLPAKAVNVTINRTKNYLTIDKGSNDGVNENMAVCSYQGVVGMIKNVTNNYSVVLPLINTSLRLSAKIKKNNYYGSLQWDGEDYRYSYLRDIPFHVNVEQGDTIVTSGFSSIFPEGEIIGYVESVDRVTANFLLIKVELATDFNNLYQLYIISNKNREEQTELEEKAYNE
jgi:rod shape-determining protein MreC